MNAGFTNSVLSVPTISDNVASAQWYTKSNAAGTVTYRSNPALPTHAAPRQTVFGQIAANAVKVIRLNLRQAILGRQIS
jgi:hypothetical protein